MCCWSLSAASAPARSFPGADEGEVTASSPGSRRSMRDPALSERTICVHTRNSAAEKCRIASRNWRVLERPDAEGEFPPVFQSIAYRAART